MMQHVENLRRGLESAFIKPDGNTNLAYKPEFISNDQKLGKRVISSIEQELVHCEEFLISVAFITLGGITPLLQVLKELEEKGIKGKILTTDYQCFTDPKALEKLHQLKNIDLKIYRTNEDQDGFHTKGYIFRNSDEYRIIIGSSNMTAKALKVNREWNTKIVGYETGEMVSDILKEFRSLWIDEHSCGYEEFIDSYKVRFHLIREQKRIARLQKPLSYDQFRLQPNLMQVEFVKNIQKIIAENKSRALLISATGAHAIIMTGRKAA